MTHLAILILAAGASSRMNGRDKLLEPINGTPLLAVMVARAQATGMHVFVTLPDHSNPRLSVIGDHAIPVFVPDAASGMAASLRAGIAALPDDCTAAMIIPADMPDLQTADFNRMIENYADVPGAQILRATSKSGQHGHPVIFPQRFFQEIHTLIGDRGAAPILRKHAAQVRTITLAENRATTDLDTPKDWDDWRAAQQIGP